jgi:hypothetical protein
MLVFKHTQFHGVIFQFRIEVLFCICFAKVLLSCEYRKVQNNVFEMTKEREYYRKQLQEEVCKLNASGILRSRSARKKGKIFI